MDTAHDDRTELLLALGRGLHQAGLSDDSLEETLLDVARRLGVALQVNALPTSLVLAVGSGFAQQGDPATRARQAASAQARAARSGRR